MTKRKSTKEQTTILVIVKAATGSDPPSKFYI
jgi:hypothetical protein